jgi:hypothetical protein
MKMYGKKLIIIMRYASAPNIERAGSEPLTKTDDNWVESARGSDSLFSRIMFALTSATSLHFRMEPKAFPGSTADGTG